MRSLEPLPGAAGALLCLGTLALLAGCGGGGSEATTVERTVTETVEGGETTAAEDEGGETTAGADDEGGKPGTGDDEALPLNSFQSPSGNIGCLISGAVVRCDIGKHLWAAPRPSDCPPQVDAGQGLEVGRSGRGEVVCAGDTVLDPSAVILPYGKVARSGGFVCASSGAGIRCEHQGGGHGFFLSAQSYRLF